jgi:hypothetical protein
MISQGWNDNPEKVAQLRPRNRYTITKLILGLTTHLFVRANEKRYSYILMYNSDVH